MRQILLSDAIADYRRYRLSEGKGVATLRNDKQVLTAFLTYVGNIYTHNVTHQKMTEHIARRTDTRGPGSIGIDVTVLRSFYRWAADVVRICPSSRNPMVGRKVPRAPEIDYPRVPPSDFPYLLEQAGKRHPRDRAFIALAMFTFGRSSEICSLKVGDLDLAVSRLKMYIHKVKRVDNMGVCNELDREMRRWLAFYSQECGNLEDDWYLAPARLLVRKPGMNAASGITRLNPTRPITHAPKQIIQPALAAIGWTELKGTGVHTIRRSVSQAAYLRYVDSGYDNSVRLVKEMLHHKDFKTTEKYIGVSGDKQRRDDMLIGQDLFGLPGQLEIGAVEDGQGEDHRAAL